MNMILFLLLRVRNFRRFAFITNADFRVVFSNIKITVLRHVQYDTLKMKTPFE